MNDRRLLDGSNSPSHVPVSSAVDVDWEKDRAFNKTIAAQLNTLLQREFDDDDDDDASHRSATGAGRSFTNSVQSDRGTLETVVRLHRQRVADAVPDDIYVRQDAERQDGEHGTYPQMTVGAGAGGMIDTVSGASSSRVENGSASDGLSSDPTTDSGLHKREANLFTQLAGVKHDIDRALANKESLEDVDRLVDSADNEFVISNPKRGTMELQQDLRLINDLVIMLCSAALGGSTFALLRQPLITGYLVAGSLVGPGGLGMIVELVQVETFAQFGIIFLLFGLGLEFNVSNLRHVQHVAVYGGALQMLLSMLVCGVISDFTGASAKEGVFVGAFLSVSSTAVVSKCLMESDDHHTLVGQITMGTLILQDCATSLLFALIPALGSSEGFSAALIRFFGILLKMLVLTLVCTVLSQLMTKRLFQFVSTHGEENYQLACVAFCLLIAYSTEHIGLSMELGAFLAGVAVSATPYAERTLRSLDPFRNIFTALFLTSIGLIMNPYFLWIHLDVLLLSVFALILFKTTLIAVVIRAFGYNMCTSFTVGVSLAQVGELSFVLLSRASGANLVERKLYLLLLGTTALSLVITPTLFRAVPGILRIAAAARLVNRDEADDLHYLRKPEIVPPHHMADLRALENVPPLRLQQ